MIPDGMFLWAGGGLGATFGVALAGGGGFGGWEHARDACSVGANACNGNGGAIADQDELEAEEATGCNCIGGATIDHDEPATDKAAGCNCVGGATIAHDEPPAEEAAWPPDDRSDGQATIANEDTVDDAGGLACSGDDVHGDDGCDPPQSTEGDGVAITAEPVYVAAGVVGVATGFALAAAPPAPSRACDFSGGVGIATC